MTTYIVLLRGINVGGHKLIKMAELKRMFESLGLGRVQTYIQSGNVLFETEETADSLRLRIEREIDTVFGMSVTVVLRNAQEWMRMIAECPYAGMTLPEGGSLHAALLAGAPSREGMDRLLACDAGIDECRIGEGVVYLLFRQSILDSKLPNYLPKLGVPATMRNWNTITKLAALAKVIEETRVS